MMENHGLKGFLMEAKRRTYAGQGDDADAAEPLLPCSKQLEWQDGSLLYRDIYFGMRLFTGLETVYDDRRAVWAMSYSGGVVDGIDDEAVSDTYRFLREALRLVPEDRPFRGPAHHKSGAFTYSAVASGHAARFEGHEEIHDGGRLCYALSYAGGAVI